MLSVMIIFVAVFGAKVRVTAAAEDGYSGSNPDQLHLHGYRPLCSYLGSLHRDQPAHLGFHTHDGINMHHLHYCCEYFIDLKK